MTPPRRKPMLFAPVSVRMPKASVDVTARRAD